MFENEKIIDNEQPFFVDRAAQGRAACRKCKQKCDKGELRLAKLAPNMFSEDGGKIKQWFHVDCMFETLLKQRLTTRRIDGPQDIGNWENISSDDQNQLLIKLNEFEKDMMQKHGDKYTPPKRLSSSVSTPIVAADTRLEYKKNNHRDNQFREFRRLCKDIANVSSYLEKTALIKELFTSGRDGDGFKGNIAQWCRLLLPNAHKRIYNLQNKQLIKLFSRIFSVNVDDMFEHLEQGDISETIKVFFERNDRIEACKASVLTMDEVEEFLEQLSNVTCEDRQMYLLRQITQRCTANDLLTIVRLIKHDLRINAGAKHILEGVHSDAYRAFQSTHDLNSVIERVLVKNNIINQKSKIINTNISLMTPVLPMLAEVCRTIEQAMIKCPHGMYSEIKYDGERVQIHKHGNELKYFSRSLKAVVEHKVKHLKDFIPQAFTHANDLILDSEILMIDNATGQPLPFGTLGIHKQSNYEHANVCLFVFDCIYYNGQDLSKYPLKERKKILHGNMTPIQNRIMFSEMKLIEKCDDLIEMIAHTFQHGLEGLVLKDVNGIYEPGKRHWLKIKKDYLFDGHIADCVDLIVLGAWYGTGRKGGMMSIFLMGCYNPKQRKWCTVTKVHTGLDDITLERLQNELNMIKISCDVNQVPNWLNCHKSMVPDFVARDPYKQPVWEITGAEFTVQQRGGGGVHTADQISIRFPRVTKIRDDKDWQTATSLPELHELVAKSKQHINDKLFEQLQQYRSAATTTATSSASRKLLLKQQPDQPFMNIFSNVKIFLLNNINNKNNEMKILLRYFVAYGGVICNESKDAQYVLHVDDDVIDNEYKLSKKKYPSDVVHVTIKWLQHSILQNAIQQANLYMVTLDQT